jgi:hypothetical protein
VAVVQGAAEAAGSVTQVTSPWRAPAAQQHPAAAASPAQAQKRQAECMAMVSNPGLWMRQRRLYWIWGWICSTGCSIERQQQQQEAHSAHLPWACTQG